MHPKIKAVKVSEQIPVESVCINKLLSLCNISVTNSNSSKVKMLTSVDPLLYKETLLQNLKKIQDLFDST